MANPIGVKVKLELMDGAGADLQGKIQKALNSAGPIEIRKIKISDNVNLASKLQSALNNQAKGSPLKISKVDISSKGKTSLHKSIYSAINTEASPVKLNRIDATPAIANLKSDLTKMLKGLTVSGLKTFLGTDGVNATFLASAEAQEKALVAAQKKLGAKSASNTVLNALEKEASSSFQALLSGGFFSGDKIAAIAAQYDAVIKKINDLRNAQNEATADEVADAAKQVEAIRALRVEQEKANAEAKKEASAQKSAKAEEDAKALASSKRKAAEDRIKLLQSRAFRIGDTDKRTGFNVALSNALDQLKDLDDQAGDVQNKIIEGVNKEVAAIESSIAKEEAVQTKAAETARVAAEKKAEAAASAAAKQQDADNAALIKKEDILKDIASARERIANLQDESTKSELSAELDDVEGRLDVILAAGEKERAALLQSAKSSVNDVTKALNTAEKSSESFVDKMISKYKKMAEDIPGALDDVQDATDGDQTRSMKDGVQDAIDMLEAYKTNHTVMSESAMADMDRMYEKRSAAIQQSKQQAAEQAKADAKVAKSADALKNRIDAFKISSPDAYRKYESEINSILKQASEKDIGLDKVNRLSDEFDRISIRSKSANISIDGFFNSLASGWKQIATFATVAKNFEKIVAVFKQMLAAVKEIDAAMTELKKVTDLTDQAYENFKSTAANSAREIGATLSDTVNATADFARLGYDLEESLNLAEAALTYKNVGDGITDVSVATESLISTIKAFGIEASDSMEIVDKFNEVGNNFAISSKGVGDALQRSAAALAAAGNNIDQSIGLVTAMNSVIQNPDSVGTALKTMSMFLRAAKTDAESAGIETDGMAESVSKLQDEILALSGVDIMMADGQTFKSTFQIIEELSNVWDKLSDVSQANILNLIGGKRNANVVTSLIKNFDDAKEAMIAAQEATGSATIENEKYLDSINGKLAQLKANFESLSESLIDSEWFKGIIDVASGFLEILTSLNEMHALIPGIVAGFTAMNMFSRKRTTSDAFGNIISLVNAGIAENKDNSGILQSVIPVIDALNGKEREYLATKLMSSDANRKISGDIAKSILDLGNMKKATEAVGKSSSGFLGIVTKGLSAFSKFEIAISAITIALSAFSMWRDYEEQKSQKMIDAGNEVIKTYDNTNKSVHSNIETLSEMRSEFDILSAGVGEHGENISLTADEYDRYNELLREIINISPSIAHSYDGERIAMESYVDVIGQAIDAQRTLQEEAEKTKMSSSKTLFEGWREQYNKDHIAASVAQSKLDIALAGLGQIGDSRIWADALKDIGISIGDTQDYLSPDEKDMRILAEQWETYYAGIVKRINASGIISANSPQAENILRPIREALAAFSTAMTPMNSMVEREVDYITSYMQYWADHGSSVYDGILSIPKDALDEFKDGLSNIIDPSLDETENLNNAKKYLDSYTMIMNEYGHGIQGYLGQLQRNEITIEQYNQRMDAVRRSLNEAYSDTPHAVDAVVDYFLNQTNAIDTATDSLNRYYKASIQFPHAISDASTAIAEGNEIMAKAQQEMLVDGKISSETFDALNGMMKEGENVFDYLTQNNDGGLLLDINKFYERNIALANENKDAISRQTDELEHQANAYKNIAEAMRMRDGDNQSADGKEYLEGTIADLYGSNLRDGLVDGLATIDLQDATDAGWSAIDDVYAQVIRYAERRNGEQLDLPLAITVTPTTVGTDGNTEILSSGLIDNYIEEVYAEAKKLVDGGMYDGSIAEAMLAIDDDGVKGSNIGGKNIFLAAAEEQSDQIDEAYRQQELNAKSLKMYMNAYVGYEDYAGADTVDAWAEQASAQAADFRGVLNEYTSSVSASIEEANSLAGRTNLDPMWDAIGTIGERATAVQEAVQTASEGTRLGLNEINSLIESAPELDADGKFRQNMLSEETAEGQAKILNDYAQQYEDACDSIIQAQIDAFKAQKDGATDEQKAAIEGIVAMLTGLKNMSLSDLFPTEEEIEPANEQMAEAISTIQEYRDLRNAIDEDARKGGKLTDGTIESLVELFGENYERYLSFDGMGNLLGANAEEFDSWYGTHINGLKGMQGATAWLTTGFIGLLDDIFNTTNEVNTNDLDQLSDSLSKFASAGDLLARQGTADANSYDALRDMLSLIEDFEIPKDKWSEYFSFGDDGALTIHYDKLTSFLEDAASGAEGLDEQAQAYAKSLLYAAKETTSLSDSMSEIGGYTDLFGTISDELSSGPVSSGPVNSLDTLASFIDSMDSLGKDWMDYVKWDNGPIIDTASAIELVNARIDELIPTGDGATQSMINLNAAMKTQAEEAIKVAKASKTVAERSGDIGEAIAMATDIGPTLELTREQYNQLIEINKDYEKAVSDVNGTLILNRSEYQRVTTEMVEHAAGLAEAKAQILESDDAYQKLVNSTVVLSDEQKDQLDAIQDQIDGYRSLAAEIINAANALNGFAEANQSPTTELYDLAKDAYGVINSVRNDQDSELYGHYGNEAYLQALSLIPFAEGTDEFNASMERLERWFGQEDSGDGVANFIEDLQEVGAANDGLIEGDNLTGTLKDWAKAFGVTEDAVAAMITQVNQLLSPENQIKLQTSADKIDSIRASLNGEGSEAPTGETLEEVFRNYIHPDLLEEGAESMDGYENRIAGSMARIKAYLQEGGAASEAFVADLKSINAVGEDGTLLKTTSEIAKELDITDELVKNMIKTVNHQPKEAGLPTLKLAEDASASSEMNAMYKAAVDAGTAIDMLNGKSISINVSGATSAIGELIGALQDVASMIGSINSMSISINGGMSAGGIIGGGISKLRSFVSRFSGGALARGTVDARGGKTLVGELGMETVVDPERGEYYTVGERGAEFVDLPKHAIVFNDKDTRDLFGGRTASRQRYTGRAMSFGSSLKNLVVSVGGTLSSLSSIFNSSSKKKNSSSSSNNSGSSSGGGEQQKTVSGLEGILEKYEEIIAKSEHLIEHQEFLFDKAKNGLDYDGMNAALEEQVRLYRKIMADAQKAIKKMRKAGAKDTDEELQKMEEAYWSAYRSLYDTLDEINNLYTDALNDKIDDLQNAFKTFVEIADQMSDGSISIDLFQEVLENGIEYMSLLDKVGDQYVVNEEKLKAMLAAQKEQLAIESALSYIKKVSIALSDDDNQKLASLLDLTNQISDSSWDIVYAKAAELKTLGLTDEQYEQLMRNINSMRDLAMKTSVDLSKEADDLYKTQRDAVDYIYDKTKELVKFELDEQIEALEEQIDAYDEIIDKKIEMIELAKEENDYADSISEKTKELAEIQSKIDQLSLDDSREARAERAKLIAEREDLQKELDQAQQDHAYDLQVEALEKDRESYTEERESEIEELENSLSSEEKLHQAVLDRIQSGWDTLHEDLLKWNAEHGSVLNKEITENWELALQAAEKYGSYIEALDVFQNGTPSVSIGGDSTSAEDLPHYHSGGIVDDRGALNDEEVLAVLKKGEMVLNDNAKDGVFEVIDFVQELSRRLGKKIGDIASPYRSALNSIAGIPNAGGRLVAVGGNHSETFSPVFNVSISHSGNMTDADAMNYGRRIANTALDTLYDAFKGRGITDAITRQRL